MLKLNSKWQRAGIPILIEAIEMAKQSNVVCYG